MNREQLIAFIEKNDLSNLLDDDVHDVKSNEATDINNGGPTAQIDCLLAAGYDLDTIQSKVTEDEEDDVESQEPYDRVGAEPEPETD